MSTESQNGIRIPNHSMPSDYSDVQPKSYDPEYISHISSQMQVPDRIAVSNLSDQQHSLTESGGTKSFPYNGMTVPDRILVAGDNQHIGMKSDLALHLRPEETVSSEAMSYVGLLTPPRTLTTDEAFPVVEAAPKKETESRLAQPTNMINGHLVPTPPYDPGVNPDDSLLLNEEDEVTLLRTQISKLARRVEVMEDEHKKRSQREFVLYPFVFGYFLWKILGWLARDSRG